MISITIQLNTTNTIIIIIGAIATISILMLIIRRIIDEIKNPTEKKIRKIIEKT